MVPAFSMNVIKNPDVRVCEGRITKMSDKVYYILMKLETTFSAASRSVSISGDAFS